MSKEQKLKYYSLKPILSKHATYNVIIGERSNGKTYSVLTYAIHSYFNGGGELAYIRRWREDVTGRRASDVFSTINQDGVVFKESAGRYTGICYMARKFYFCNYDDEGKPVYNEQDIFCHTFALSEMEHDKGISFPKVQIILFDEFLSRRMYLPDEFVLFMDTVSTIVRQRDNVQIFMLGNTVNKFCPYFQEMGLKHVEQMKQGSIDIYNYGDSRLTVAVEYCATVNTQKKSNFYFAFDNPKLHMITEGAWALDIYPHCPCRYRPKDVIFIYFIEFNGYLYQCEIVSLPNTIFTFIHLKTTELKNPDSDIVFSLDFNPKLNYNRSVLKPGYKQLERVSWFFTVGRVYYQNNEVGDAIHNYLNICRGL